MAATGSGGDSDPGGTFYRPRAAPRRRGDVEVVGGGCGVVGATGRGDEGVVGEVAWLWENVRTHAEDAERLWRTLTRFGDGGCGAGSAKTKATETKKVRGPLGSERRRGRNGWRAHTQMGRPI